ncbi:MAG: hypothetical protein NDJ24_09550 [Alphaproteobacteria bacterium]|nr:hypothetical protein [Alphaproteobacteria bacterium]
MSIGETFKSVATGRSAAYILSLTLLAAGAGGNAYSAFYDHGTGTTEGLQRRVQFCQRDYQGCATDRKQLEDCLLEKSILRQSARMNSLIMIFMGLMVLTGAGVASLNARNSAAKPPTVE